MKKIFFIFTAAISIFIAGCKSTGSSSNVSAKGTSPSAICGEWKILSLTGFENAEKTEATLSILANEEGGYSLNGYGGVNRYFANLPDSPKAFPIKENLASTKMMGMPECMAFEDKLLEVIALAKSWKIEGGRLTVTSGKTSAVFVK